MEKKIEAIDVAEWFIWYNNFKKSEVQYEDDLYDVYEGLTHLKVQKLLYYAQGVYSAVTNHNLFDDEIYAWQHGPVVRNVYNLLSKYGRQELEFDENFWDKVKSINEDEEMFNILELVYDHYAGYTAWQLREKTHVAGGPWQVTVDNKGMLKKIDKDLIKTYFKDNIVG